MAVFEMNRGLSVYSQGIQQIASLALLGLLAPFVYGQENAPPAPPPDNPLAAPFVKQLHAWMDSDGDHFLKEFSWTETPQRSWITRYRLYIPTHASSDHLVPLLVWMHGACEGGTDNKKHLVYLDELLFRDGQKPPECAILAVQTPTGTWPREESPLRDDPLSVVSDIIDHVLANHPVDVDRVLLSGVSSGADACWCFACRHPDHIAAICPLGSQGDFLGEATRLTNVGVWCFHSSNDLSPPPNGARTMVEAINAAGGRARFTLTPANDGFPHNCWHTAYRDYHAMDWLLAQKRHKTSILDRTGVVGVHVHQRVIGYFRNPEAGSQVWWYALAAFVGMVLVRARIRRRKSQPKPTDAPS